MKRSFAVALLSLMAAGCASTPSAPEQAATGSIARASERDEVQQLTAYPASAYDNLGIAEFSFFRPGFRTPSVNDVLPELRSRVHDFGGNAFIVRHTMVDRNDKRLINVSAEVLRLKPS